MYVCFQAVAENFDVGLIMNFICIITYNTDCDCLFIESLNLDQIYCINQECSKGILKQKYTWK